MHQVPRDDQPGCIGGAAGANHVLDQGRTLAEGTPDEIRANLDVAAAYLGESAVHEGGE